MIVSLENSSTSFCPYCVLGPPQMSSLVPHLKPLFLHFLTKFLLIFAICLLHFKLQVSIPNHKVSLSLNKGEFYSQQSLTVDNNMGEARCTCQSCLVK